MLVNRNTVFDRACLGSMVYGQIKNDPPNSQPVTEIEKGKFDDYVFQTHSLLVYAFAPEAVLKQRFKKRGDSYLSIQEIIKAGHLYRTLFDTYLNSYVRVLEYDSSQYTAVSFIEANTSSLATALWPATGHVTDYKAARLLK